MTLPLGTNDEVCRRCGSAERIELRRWVGEDWIALVVCPVCCPDHPVVQAVLNAVAELFKE